MISKSNFKDINQAVWHTQTKIIFVGDEARRANAQIVVEDDWLRSSAPPVGESEPIVAQSEYIQNEATLSSIVRYDGDIAQRVAQIVALAHDWDAFASVLQKI